MGAVTAVSALVLGFSWRVSADSQADVVAAVPPACEDEIDVELSLAEAWELERSDVAALATPGRQPVAEPAPPPPIRARIVVRGELSGTRGLARELDLRLYAGFVRKGQQLPVPHHTDIGWTPVDGSAVQHGVGIEPRFVEGSSAREAERDKGLQAFASSDGSFDRDLGELVAGAPEIPAGFVVSIRHENFRPLDVWVPFEERGRALDADRLSEEREVALAFAVELTPVCRIRGSAACVDGDCKVRLEAWSIEQGAPTGISATASVSAAGDVFELAVAPDRRYAIVALADGYLPQTVIAHAWGELDLWLAPFVLDHGVTLSGQFDLSRHSFGPTPSLYLSQEGPVLRRDVYGPSELVWTGYEFRPETRAARAREDGRFEFAGLAPGAYELHFGIERGAWTEMDPFVTVYAPAEGLSIAAPLAHVTFEIEQDGLPVRARALRIQGSGSDGGSAQLVTDGRGRAEAWLFGGELYVVHVSRPEGADWSYAKVAPRLAPWGYGDAVERIAMGSTRRGR